MKLWLAMDPETRRVTAQPREWQDGAFPRGLRGVGWPRATIEVPDDALDELLTGTMSFAAVDLLHRSWWDAAQPADGPKWPHLPDGT